jgi:DNA invertase Pin-like site-specific DNA recombinase
MIKAVIYRRVSSQRQSDEGKSLEDQDAELRDYCHAMRWAIIGNFKDVESGRREKTERRFGLDKAVRMACEHKATLVVYDLDRLTRSPLIGEEIFDRLRQSGAQLVVKSLGIDTNSPGGELVLMVMLSVARWLSRNIGAGVMRANRQSKDRNGYRTQGCHPFGWQWNPEAGQRIRNPTQQLTLAKIHAMHANHASDSIIARELNAIGTPAPKGGVWYSSTVERVRRQAKEAEKAERKAQRAAVNTSS